VRFVRFRLALAPLGLVATLAACGNADSAMPEPPPCPAVTPTPQSAFGRRDPLGAFRLAVNQNVARIEKLTSDFRQRYPNGSFYRGSFRTDFARYIDETVCIALAMHELPLPAGLATTRDTVDGALDGFIAHQRAGREAVRSRNVSGYKDWSRGIDAQAEALRGAP